MKFKSIRKLKHITLFHISFTSDLSTAEIIRHYNLLIRKIYLQKKYALFLVLFKKVYRSIYELSQNQDFVFRSNAPMKRLMLYIDILTQNSHKTFKKIQYKLFFCLFLYCSRSIKNEIFCIFYHTFDLPKTKALFCTIMSSFLSPLIK